MWNTELQTYIRRVGVAQPLRICMDLALRGELVKQLFNAGFDLFHVNALPMHFPPFVTLVQGKL